MKLTRILLMAIFFALDVSAEEFENRIQGDLGIFINAGQSPIKGDSMSPLPLPYTYFDYGRAFTRIDTFGIKTLPIAYGHLEIVGRIKFDGYKSAGNAELNGINDRQNSIPIGLGTFQLTPIGGFFLYAFHDVNKSKGNLLEATYAAQIKFGESSLYPQVGLEYFSSQYMQYYYGVSAAEAAASGYATYTPGASTKPFFCLMLEVPVTDGWIANFYARRKWLGSAITNSPLVNKKTQDSGFVTVAYRFK
jgi:outer membrane protein